MGFNEKEEHLYHFTTFEAATKILATNKLRFSRTNNSNDVLESNRLIFYGPNAFEDKNFDSEAIYKEVMKHRQISLTSDDFSRIPHKYGFCINPMWGHYADKGNGVCIVLNKKKLLTKLTNPDYHCNKIKYVDKYDNSLDENDINDTNRLIDNFFVKTNDWEYEHEFRIVKKVELEKDDYLDIEGCVDCIIMNRAKDISHYESVFSSFQYEVLKKLYDETCIYKYGVWSGKKGLSDCNGNPIWSEYGLGWKIDLNAQ